LDLGPIGFEKKMDEQEEAENERLTQIEPFIRKRGRGRVIFWHQLIDALPSLLPPVWNHW